LGVLPQFFITISKTTLVDDIFCTDPRDSPYKSFAYSLRLTSILDFF